MILPDTAGDPHVAASDDGADGAEQAVATWQRHRRRPRRISAVNPLTQAACDQHGHQDPDTQPDNFAPQARPELPGPAGPDQRS